jgi:hypothetical protein
MKKLILILFTFLMANGIYSQGNNLQFNRVVNESSNVTVNNSSELSAGSITVPANKVLKITSASIRQDNATGLNRLQLRIGNHIATTFNSYDIAPIQNSFPLWLEAGNHSVIVSRGLAGTADLIWSISGVEFNIVQ